MTAFFTPCRNELDPEPDGTVDGGDDEE